MGTLAHKIRRLAAALARHTPPFNRLLSEVAAARRTEPELAAARRAFRFAPPGHYYSPIPAVDEMSRDADRLFGQWPRELPGISLNVQRQLALLSELSSYYPDLPFSRQRTAGCRYFFDNPMYPQSDAIFLYAMIRHLKPKRIVEIGSGYSSCVMLDTNERFLDNRVACTFVDPFPERLLSLLSTEDRSRVEIIPKRLQDIEVAWFRELDANDILFIDSSHVLKLGSDVHYLVSEVLPALRIGVHVHLHDVFYPFEYPRAWIDEGRYWTEAYVLRAFLAFNSAFEIVLFNTYLQHFYREQFVQHMPLCLERDGGSIWIRRTA